MKEVTIDKSLFYDKTPCLSYNSLFNFVLGGRGVGKTFSFKEWAIKSDYQTVWVRRYREDIEKLTMGNKFISDLIAEGKLDGLDIKLDNNVLWVNGEEKVFFIPLSTARRVKSQSFAGVDKIIFDELLEETRTKYLKDEVNLFLNLYETVARLREVRVFFLSNKATFVNPYFTFWGITPFTQRFKKFGSDILVENYQNKEFSDYKKNTRFGKLIAGSRFADYIIDNECWLDDNAFIKKRETDSKFKANIRYNGVMIGLWLGHNGFYCTKEINKDYRTYTPRYEMVEGDYPLDTKYEPFTWLSYAYDNGKLYFSDNIVKQTVFNILQGQFK